MADHALHAAAQVQADFRQLRGFSRAGLATHDHDLMRLDSFCDFAALRADRQFLRIRDLRQASPPLPCLQRGLLRVGKEFPDFRGYVLPAARCILQPPHSASQRRALAQHAALDGFAQHAPVDGGGGGIWRDRNGAHAAKTRKQRRTRSEVGIVNDSPRCPEPTCGAIRAGSRPPLVLSLVQTLLTRRVTKLKRKEHEGKQSRNRCIWRARGFSWRRATPLPPTGYGSHSISILFSFALLRFSFVPLRVPR